jgi:hypothetical protein
MFRSGEIRIVKSNGTVERVIAFDNTDKDRFVILGVSGVVTWMLPFRCANLGSPARAMRIE